MKCFGPVRAIFEVLGSQVRQLILVLLLVAMTGCSAPPETGTEKPAVDPPKEKAPATTAYGKAMEATERLKDQAKEYNDRLEKLNDPFAK